MPGMGASAGKALVVVLLLLGVHSLDLCFALNEEGRALPRFRERIEINSYEFLLNWGEKEGEVDPCAWNGVTCEDGRVVSPNRGNAIRRLQSGEDDGQDGGRHVEVMPPPSAPWPPSASPHPTPGISPLPSEKSPSPLPISPPSPPSVSPTPEKRKSVLIYGLIGGIAGILIFIFAAFVLFRVRKVSVRPWALGLSGQLQKAFVTGLPKLKQSELQTACEDFSNIVGTLMDGTLYKGTLSNGVEISVSIIKTDDWPEQSQAQFRKKIATLSKVNHKNFVNLIGYCEDEEPFSRMVVFEYSPNGKLFEHLHSIDSRDHLDWNARLRIAMGVGYCLDYMLGLSPPIVITKLDSTVIYLTDDFAAKIADLELYSNILELETTGSGPLHVPEKVVRLFGMLLLELISGRSPFSGENGGLIYWVTDFLNDKKPAKDAMDPCLGSVCSEDFEAVFDIVRECLHNDPAQRPSMDLVVAKLKGITSITPEGAAPRLSPLWWAEIEIMSRDTA